MKRLTKIPRADWVKKVEERGLIYHHSGEKVYWDESAYYVFTAQEVDSLEFAANTLQDLCLKAAQHIIDTNRFAELGIPPKAIETIKWAWDQEPPALYGRFDMAFDGMNPPKLLEYNADTPTSLLEAAVIQWDWLQELFPHSDQFNSLHERLVAKWRDLKGYITGKTLYFTCLNNPEDLMTLTYLRETATQAGLVTQALEIADIGWEAGKKRFVDNDMKTISSLFKLYPWEWLLAEPFGDNALEIYQSMQWIEPVWKMLLSNKGLLPILWELFPNHPNLLEAHFEKPSDWTSYVRKPLLSREGANVRVVTPWNTTETEGPYGAEGWVYQALANLPAFGGKYPVLGLWMIDQECGGMGIRESEGLISDNQSTFVPHYFE